MPAPAPRKAPDPVAESHRGLRRALGWIGAGLPVALLALPALLGIDTTAFHGSLSAHYHAPNVGAVFVGALAAIGVFLLYYRGYPVNQVGWCLPILRGPLGRAFLRHATDSRVTTIAGGGAIGTALVPVTIPGACGPALCSDVAHAIFAGTFFLAVTVLVLCLFTLSDRDPATWERGKRRDNAVYIGCGITMAACVALIGLGTLAEVPLPFLGDHPVYWLETIAIWAFALAWLRKGRALEPVFRALGRGDPA
jgi:hypothetical protein